MMISPAVAKRLRYDPPHGFMAVGGVVSYSCPLVTRLGTPAARLTEFVADAK